MLPLRYDGLEENAMKKFVITGIGRSATKYTSDLLTTADIPTTWEKTFNVHKKGVPETGDSSWLAAPFLSELPAGTVVLHQTRNPLKWLQSWIRSTARWPDDHLNFVAEYSQIYRWLRLPRPQSDMRVWVQWHRMIEAQVQAKGFPYLRFKVEDLDLAKMQEIATLIDAPFKNQKANKALEKVAKNTNTSNIKRPHPKKLWNQDAIIPAPVEPTLTWAGLPTGPELDAFKALAEEYGYATTD